MKTLKTLIEEKKIRKGTSDGINGAGAFWLASEVKIRSYGGDGIGQCGASMSHKLYLRHYRSGAHQALVVIESFHQNDGSHKSYEVVNEIFSAKSCEEVIEIFSGKTHENLGHKVNLYSAHFENDLVDLLKELGLPLAPDSPDE